MIARFLVFLVFPLLALGACTGVPARDGSTALLSSQALRADVDVLQRAYETLHPGLYRYNTPARMQARFAQLRATFATDRSLADAYLAFSEFAATIRCGHTYANFHNQIRPIQQALFERTDRVPFYFRWLDDRMIVTRNFSDRPELKAGTEIVSIDGVPARSILHRMMAIARADGSNDAKRVAWLQVQGDEVYEAFDIFLPLLYPRIGARMSLVTVAPDGAHAQRTVRVDALSYAARLAARPARTDANGPPWTLDTSDPAFAVLRMPTWALYESTWDWKGFINAAIVELVARRTPALVIDLRGNEGGMDVGDELLRHFISEPLRIADYERRVRYRKVPDDLLPYLHTWDASFKDWGDAAIPLDDRFFRLTRFDDGPRGNVLQPAATRYVGRVFVLVGATNSSATFEFAQVVKRSGLATLVGQTTGGNQRGINGGAFFFLRLPHSKIELDLPLIGQFPTDARPDAGVEPDVPVSPTIRDIAEGRDSELDAVRSILGNRAR